MNSVNDYLNKRASDLMVYKMPKNNELMDEIFAFDPRNLESTKSADISKYAIGLAQFLIFFSSQINKSRVQLIQKNRVIDLAVNGADVKGTKAEKRQKVIDSSEDLQRIKLDIEALELEIKMTENLEKYYVELINAFKRELTRREFELKFSRDERRL